MRMSTTWTKLLLLATVSLFISVNAVLLPLPPELETCTGTPSQPPASTPGECVAYEDHINGEGSLGFCSGVVDYPYYRPVGTTQQALEQLIASKFSPTAQLLLPLLSGTCLHQFKVAVCSSTFQRCEKIDPFFLQKCASCVRCTGDSVPRCNSPGLEGLACTILPGYAPYTTITYEAIYQQNSACPPGMEWDADAKSCFAYVPKTPCSGDMCEPIQDFSSTCPLISGQFHTALNGLYQKYTGDGTHDTLRATISDTLGACLGQDTDECKDTVYNMNAVSLFGLNLDCDATIPDTPFRQFSKEVIGEVKGTNDKIGEFIVRNQKKLVDGNGQNDDVCGTYPVNDPRNSCAAIAQKSLCSNEKGSFKVQPSFTTIGSDVQGRDRKCLNVTTSAVNQPTGVDFTLLKLATGLNDEQVRGLYYVPTQPGLPPLPVSNGGDAGFMAHKASGADLCAYPTTSGDILKGKSSLDCLLNQLEVGLAAVPGWVNSECRAAFLDMACSKAMMKLEVKSLCLNSEGCAAVPGPDALVAKKLPLVFALPRFAPRALCDNMFDKCDAYIGSLDAGLQALLKSRLSCDQKIDIKCQAGVFESGIWNCASPFNGLDAFPSSQQTLADLRPLIAALGLTNPIDEGAIIASATSNAVKPTISDQNVWDKFDRQDLCDCPYPLRVPKNPNNASTGLTEFTCCKLACEGSFFEPEQIEGFISLQLLLSIPNFLASAFVVITWALFKTRGEQKLTLFFALNSMAISAVFLISLSGGDPVDEVWCKDDTTPFIQSDGGMCLFQAIGISFFSLTACCWWWCQAFALFQKIYMGRRKTSNMTYFHIFSWGWPAIVTAIFLGKGSLGYRAPQPWCFFADNGDDSSGFELGLWYGTIFVITITGITMMSLVMYTMFTITSGSSKRTNRLRIYQVPIFFVLFFVFVWVIIITWRMDIESQRQYVSDGVIPWVTCLLSNFAGGITDPATNPLANTTILDGIRVDNQDLSGCGTVYPRGFGEPMFYVVQFVATAQGIMVYLIFGLMPQNYRLWAVFLGCRDPDILKDNVDKTITGNTGENNKRQNPLQRLYSTMTGTGTDSEFGAPANTMATFASLADETSDYPEEAMGYVPGGSFSEPPGLGGGSFNGSFSGEGSFSNPPPGLGGSNGSNNSMNDDIENRAAAVPPPMPPRPKNPISRFTARMSRMITGTPANIDHQSMPAKSNRFTRAFNFGGGSPVPVKKTELESSPSFTQPQVNMSELQRAQQAVAMRRRKQLQEWKEKAGMRKSVKPPSKPVPPPESNVVSGEGKPSTRTKHSPSDHRERHGGGGKERRHRDRDGKERKRGESKHGQRKHHDRHRKPKKPHGATSPSSYTSSVMGKGSFDDTSDNEGLDSLI